MNQYTKIWLTVVGALCLAVIDGQTASFSTVEGASGSQYVTYDGVKRSRFCRFMRASRCAQIDGFLRYLNAGCVNDTDSESKCLQTFCGQNCAGYSCPDPNSTVGQACQQHCRFVNLRNAAAQARLQACVRGAYSSSQAADKEAGRTYDRAQLRAVRGQQKGADQEARRILSQIQKYIRARDSLFISMRRSASRTLKNWILAADKAKQYTASINQMNASLQGGEYPQDRKKQALVLVNRSNMLTFEFVKMVGSLNRYAEELGQAVSNRAANSAPMGQSPMAEESFVEPSAPSFEDLPPPPPSMLNELPPPYTATGRVRSSIV